MPTLEPFSRCYRHLKRNMSNLYPMCGDQLRTCVELAAESGENSENTEGNRRNLLLLDCRSFVAYNVGHIADAVNVHCPAILRRRSRGCLPLRTVIPNANVLQLLNSGGCYPVVLYDEIGSVPNSATNKVSDEQLSTVEFVAKCLLTEASIKTVFYLEGGYQNFSRKFPHLCSPATTELFTTSLSSPPLHSCPVLGRQPNRSSGLPLSSKTFREQHQETRSDYGPVEILPHLWLGSAGDASRSELLQELGITALLNVSSSGACPELLTILKGLRYKSIPLRDTPCQVIDCFFQEAFEFIETERSRGKILVHCRAGISRSATICIAYLMWRKRLKMDEAYEHVKSRRRIVSPNFNFMGQLLAFERQLFDTCCYKQATPATTPTHRDQDKASEVFDFRSATPTPTDKVESILRSPL